MSEAPAQVQETPAAQAPTPTDHAAQPAAPSHPTGSDPAPATPQGPGASPQASAGEQPQTPADWRAALPEEVRNSPALKDITGPEALAAQFVNLQGHLGNSIRIPSEHASQEDWQAFYGKLAERVPGVAPVKPDDPDAFRTTMRQFGAPEEASGYKLPELPSENLQQVAGFADMAHRANLTQAQFEAIATEYTEAQQHQVEQQLAQHNANIETLHREWGFAYEEKVQNAKNLAKLTGAPEALQQAIDDNRLDAQSLRWLATMAESYGEADIGADRRAERTELTPDEARAQYEEILRNKEHPYWDRYMSPAKQQAIDLMLRLKEKSMGPGSRQPAVVLGQHEYDV